MSARIIGLTGQTGAGKSTVCRVLEGAGFSIVDCDALTREVQSAGSPCVEALAAAFGRDILLEGGALNRKRLAGLAFGDAERLALLNRTVHPFIMAALENRIKALACGQTKGIVLDAPTLFESGADALCGEVVAVIAPTDARLRRIMARDGLSEEQARARMQSQREDAFYTARAQHIIVNDGSPELLRQRALSTACALKGVLR